MPRDPKRDARLASLETRLIEISQAFLELNAEAQLALHDVSVSRTHTNISFAPMSVVHSLGVLLSRLGLEADADESARKERLRRFLDEFPEDARAMAAFQASCLLFREVTELLLALSREQSPDGTDARLARLMRQFRPKSVTRSGTYRLSGNEDVEPLRPAEVARDIRKRFSTLPPAAQNRTITSLRRLMPKKGT